MSLQEHIKQSWSSILLFTKLAPDGLVQKLVIKKKIPRSNFLTNNSKINQVENKMKWRMERIFN